MNEREMTRRIEALRRRINRKIREQRERIAELRLRTHMPVGA